MPKGGQWPKYTKALRGIYNMKKRKIHAAGKKDAGGDERLLTFFTWPKITFSDSKEISFTIQVAKIEKYISKFRQFFGNVKIDLCSVNNYKAKLHSHPSLEVAMFHPLT